MSTIFSPAAFVVDVFEFEVSGIYTPDGAKSMTIHICWH